MARPVAHQPTAPQTAPQTSVQTVLSRGPKWAGRLAPGAEQDLPEELAGLEALDLAAWRSHDWSDEWEEVTGKW
jgi:hypothetical protein